MFKMFPKIVIHSGRVKRFTRWSHKPKTQGSTPSVRNTVKSRMSTIGSATDL